MFHQSFFEPFYLSLIELSSSRTRWKVYSELIQRGARAGDDQARYVLASAYLHGVKGVRVKRDVRTGLRLLRKASRTNHLAMLDLASCHECGEHGLKESPRLAFQLFERAADFGSVAGRFHLGRCLWFGIGVKVDRRRAMKLFRQSAALGFPAFEALEASVSR